MRCSVFVLGVHIVSSLNFPDVQIQKMFRFKPQTCKVLFYARKWTHVANCEEEHEIPTLNVDHSKLSVLLFSVTSAVYQYLHVCAPDQIAQQCLKSAKMKQLCIFNIASFDMKYCNHFNISSFPPILYWLTNVWVDHIKRESM